MPRRTVRLRLTLLYSGLFLVSGAALLVITYLLVVNRFPVLNLREVPGNGDIIRICARPDGSVAENEEFAACAEQARSLIDAQRAATVRQLLIQSGTALGIMTVVSLGLGWLVAGREIGRAHV